MHQTAHADDRPVPMDRPRQSDSFARHMEGQVIGKTWANWDSSLRSGEEGSITTTWVVNFSGRSTELHWILDYKHILSNILVIS